MHAAQSVPEMLCAMVRAERTSQGLPRAIDAVARACDITSRRARSIWNAEVRRLWDDEAERIQAAFEARMERRIAQLDAESAMLRARLENARNPHVQPIDGAVRAMETRSLAQPQFMVSGPG